MNTTTSTARPYLSPGQIAEDLSVDLRKVLLWIKSGELRAVNLATRVNGKKPRWRISAADLEVFLASRSASPAPAAARRRRRDPNVVEFF